MNRIKKAYQKVLREQPEKVKPTLIVNKFKHIIECNTICRYLLANPINKGNPESNIAICDIGGGVGINLQIIRHLFPNAQLDLIDRFKEYEKNYDNPMGNFNSIITAFEKYDISYTTSDILSGLPYNSNNYDVATCIDVIEHIPGSSKPIMDEIYRILKPGGMLLVTCPNIVNLRNRIKVLFGRSLHVPIENWYYTPSEEFFSHFREYTRSEIEYIYEQSGFNNIKIDLFSPYLKSFIRCGIHHELKKRIRFIQSPIYCFTTRIYYYICQAYQNFRSTILAQGFK